MDPKGTVRADFPKVYVDVNLIQTQMLWTGYLESLERFLILPAPSSAGSWESMGSENQQRIKIVQIFQSDYIYLSYITQQEEEAADGRS